MSEPPVPRVFHLADVPVGSNNPTSRSARIVTPETTGSDRLYAGMFLERARVTRRLVVPWRRPG